MKVKGIELILVIVITILLGCTIPLEDPPKSDYADLTALNLSTGILKPAFDPSITNYTVGVPSTTEYITVTGDRADINASLSANNGVSQPINIGANIITISVTAQNGTTTKDYVVNVHRYNLTSFEMATVPAGSFQRDATSSNISVISTAFLMSRHEITREHFNAIMGSDPSNLTVSSGINDPVQTVNWYQSIAFCNKLSLAEGLTPVYTVSGVDFATLIYGNIPVISDAVWNATSVDWTANGYRLPTEMEWMWAAMGAPLDGRNGGVNTTGYSKPFAGSTGSEVIGDYVVFGYYGSEPGATLNQRTDPVGSKLPNELGLYDMSGNVFEWTWDWNDTNPDGIRVDYRGPATGIYRVLRGGSWYNFASDCSVAYKMSDNPKNTYSGWGFRIVRL